MSHFKTHDLMTSAALSHPLNHSFTHSNIHSFTHSNIHSFTHSHIQTFIHSHIHTFTHSLKKMETKAKKVLIALDYDPTAQKVAEEGYSLAKLMGAEVTLLHVIADPIYYSALDHVTVMGFAGYQDITTFQNDNIGVLINESREFLRTSKQHLDDDSIETVVKEGDIADSILKTAEDLKSDIIVMGSHSRKWLEKIIMGSVAEKVLSHATIPMYIIPTKKIN